MADVTIQGTVYKTYDTEVNVNSYLRAGIHSDIWNAALEDARYRAMVTTTRVFNRTRWQGTVSAGAVLAFPRDGLVDRYGVAIPDGTTPQDILDGFAEYTLLVLEDTELQAKKSTGANISSVSAGGASVTFFRGTLNTAPKFPVAVQEMIGPYMASSVTADGVYITGGGVISNFSSGYDLDPPGLP